MAIENYIKIATFILSRFGNEIKVARRALVISEYRIGWGFCILPNVIIAQIIY